MTLRSRRIRVAATLAALLVLAACADEPDDADAAADDRVADLEAQLDDAEQRIADLESELADAEARAGDLEAELAEARAADAEPPSPADLHSAEGLVDQLRTRFPTPEAAPDDWEPGATDWEALPEIPDGFAEGEAAFATPGRLMTAFAEQQVGGEAGLGREIWEATVRVLDEDPGDGRATGALLTWGYHDDAVAGSDTRLELVEEGDGWYVDSAEARFHCRRGVTDDGLCL